MVGVRARLLVFLPLVAVALGCGSSSKPTAVSTGAAPPPPPPPAAASTTLRATFRALDHRPKVNTPWRYVVGAVPNDANGRPITSLVHVRVRVNGVWLEFGSNRFTGAYQDQVSWPPSARGKLLIFEATVAQGTRLKTFRFWLRPR
jgi:hypothetical protein